MNALEDYEIVSEDHVMRKWGGLGRPDRHRNLYIYMFLMHIDYEGTDIYHPPSVPSPYISLGGGCVEEEGIRSELSDNEGQRELEATSLSYLSARARALSPPLPLPLPLRGSSVSPSLSLFLSLCKVWICGLVTTG